MQETLLEKLQEKLQDKLQGMDVLLKTVKEK